METTHSILVGYDGSSDADRALEWAAEVAGTEHLTLRVAIIENTTSTAAEIAWWPDGYWTAVEEQSREILAKAGVHDAEISRGRGSVVPTLVAQAHDATMLVVGSRGHSRAGELFMGSVSQHLAGHAPCPVVVVRPTGREVKRIVVGLDGSTGSRAALDFACRRAAVTGERVTAVRAARSRPVHLDHKGRIPDAINTFLLEEEKQLAGDMAEAALVHPDIAIEAEFVPLAPAEALVETSRHASLVVVGSRGRHAFAGMLLGSVSHEVLHRSHCTVAVVR